MDCFASLAKTVLKPRWLFENRIGKSNRRMGETRRRLRDNRGAGLPPGSIGLASASIPGRSGSDRAAKAVAVPVHGHQIGQMRI
jgi:hypothetical protein